jgi:hypothetical protein
MKDIHNRMSVIIPAAEVTLVDVIVAILLPR